MIDALYTHIRHGDSSSPTTSWVMRFNLEQTAVGLTRPALALGVGNGLLEKEAAARVADFIEDFYRKLGMPARLRDAGIPLEGIERIAEDAMGDFYLHQNARKVKSKSELTDLLKQMR